MATGSFSCALATSQSGWVQQMPDGLRGRSLEERLAISTSCRAWGTDSLASLGKFRLDFRLRSRRRGADFMRVLPSRPKARGIAVLSRPDDEFREGAEIDGNGAAGGETSPFEDQVPGQTPVSKLMVCSSCTYYSNVQDATAQLNVKSAARILGELYQGAPSLYGDSMQRVAAYFAEGLAARIVSKESPMYSNLMVQPSTEQYCWAFTTLYKVAPYFQFAHFTANQAILDAVEGHQFVRVVDLDIMQGSQWPCLIQALAARQGGPP